MKEKNEVRKLLKVVKTMPDTWYTRVEQKSIRGTPDIIGASKCPDCKYARAWMIEAKTDEGKPTPLQLETIKQLVKVGVLAVIAHLPSQLKETLESLRRLQSPGPFANDAQELFERGQE